MNTAGKRALHSASPACIQVEPARPVPDLAEDARRGLLAPPRSLPPKYFYDDRGARLFDSICDAPEYYPTRTEDALLLRHAADIIKATRPDEILELGSGSSRKTRRLFDACASLRHRCSYFPFDVTGEMLEHTAAKLRDDYPWLEVTPLLGDYHGGLANLPVREGRSLVVFLGSTIGNFPPAGARSFLKEVRSRMDADDFLLLGADRVKDPEVLIAAYNDAGGVTAAFNLNLLRVLNRELDADFDIDGFSHRAVFNPELSRIEMSLVSRRDQQVHLAGIGEQFHMRRGEGILTEVSYKFEPDSLDALLADSGFRTSEHFQPANGYFSLVLATVH